MRSSPRPPTPGNVQHRNAIQRIAAGDRDCLCALYDDTSADVFGLALRMSGGDVPDAEAITLDVYSRVWARTAVYEPHNGSVLSWLLAIARQCALAKRSLKGRRATIAEWAAAIASARADRGPSASRSLAPPAFEALSLEQRSALDLAYLGGFTLDEIARHLGLELPEVRAHLRGALGALRTALSRTPDRMV